MPRRCRIRQALLSGQLTVGVGLFQVFFLCHCFQSFPSFPRSGEPCSPCDSWISPSASHSQHFPARQSLQSLLTQTSSCLSLPLQLLACFWMQFLWGERKGTLLTAFNPFFLRSWIGKCLEVSLWVVLLFNPHCLNMALGRGCLCTMSWWRAKMDK